MLEMNNLLIIYVYRFNYWTGTYFPINSTKRFSGGRLWKCTVFVFNNRLLDLKRKQSARLWKNAFYFIQSFKTG